MDPQRAQHFTVQPLIPYQQLQAEQLLPPHIASNASPFTHRLIDASTAARFQDVPHYPGVQSIPIQMPYPQQHTPVVPLYRASDNGQLQRQIATISGAKQRPSMPERQITDTATKEQLTGQTSSVAIRTQDPPNLQEWRKKLFAVDEMLTLTQDEFETYFRYVDNVYSHRSTQRYKRNPFIAQYWDCRLKGRPPGTRKSEDPNKKKRKRVARERDQCDVKIKIVEFFPGVVVQSGFDAAMCTAASEDARETVAPGTTEFTTHPPVAASAISTTHSVPEPGWTMPLTSAGGMSIPEASAAGQKIYTILRVNGGAAGDGGTPSSHRHSLEYSDKVKRNSVARERLKDEREKKKIQKTYHKKASGPALDTVKRHSRDETLVMFGSCFCPFVQRVWISLEQKGIPYQYIEVDPYKKPQSLLDVNPRGLVPALRHGNWACNESTVLMEYLEDLEMGHPLLPPDAKSRAHSRLWADHVNRHIVPAFYHYLQAQQPDKQATEAVNLRNHLTTLIDAAASPGPFFLGSQISFVDVQLAPWLLRFSRVLKPYRAWPDPEPGTRWESWVNAIESNEAVKATTSEDVLYVESYERYAENRPDTSQLAMAINEGRGLP